MTIDYSNPSRKVSATSPCYARGPTTTTTAVGLIDDFDDEGAARQKMRKARGYMTDGDAHLPIYPPCSSRPLSLLSVISRGPVVRPFDPYRCFLRGRKSVAHRIWERRCYTQWRPIILPRPCPDFIDFRSYRRVDEAVARRQVSDTPV